MTSVSHLPVIITKYLRKSLKISLKEEGFILSLGHGSGSLLGWMIGFSARSLSPVALDFFVTSYIIMRAHGRGDLLTSWQLGSKELERRGIRVSISPLIA
jgi:hypothetical protein